MKREQEEKKRKQVVITIPANLVDAFKAAKAKAEADVGLTLTDGEYAVRLIKFAVEKVESK